MTTMKRLPGRAMRNRASACVRTDPLSYSIRCDLRDAGLTRGISMGAVAALLLEEVAAEADLILAARERRIAEARIAAGRATLTPDAGADA